MQLVIGHIIKRSFAMAMAITTCLCLLMCSKRSYAQSVAAKKAITTEFASKEVTFDNSSIISNVLKVSNNTAKPLQLILQINVPGSWKRLSGENKTYLLKGFDSLFVPVRVVPNFGNVTGSTKYSISVAVLSVEGKVMSSSFFYANKPVVSNWQMKILPRPRIYFLNNEYTANFQVNLSNDGDEGKSILVSMSTLGRGISLTDSASQPLKKTYTELFLNPYQDTLLPLSVKIEKMKRNLRRMDVDSYHPAQFEDGRKYMLFVKAGEIGKSQNRAEHSQKVNFLKLANNIDFVKLRDNMRLNQYGTTTIPLVADINTYGVLAGVRPITNMYLYGNTRVNSSAFMTYQLQSTLSSFTQSSMPKLFGSIGYYSDKGYVQGGNSGVGIYGIQGLGGSVGGGSLGVSAGHYFTSRRKISGYLTEGYFNKVASWNKPNYGVAYQDGITKYVRYAAGYRHYDNGLNYSSDNFAGTVNLNLTHGQDISFKEAVAYNKSYNTVGKTKGYNYGISYQGAFFRRKLTSNISIANIDRNYTITGMGNLYGTASTYYYGRNWLLSLQNQYSLFDNYYYNGTALALGQTKLLYNQLNIGRKSDNETSLNYFLYYSQIAYPTVRADQNGIGVNCNYYKAEQNFRLQMLAKCGFNDQYYTTVHKQFFSAQFYTLFNYHTLFMNLTYNYNDMPLATTSSADIGQVYPQRLMMSVSNQTQIGKQVIVENNVNYNYLSNLSKHSFGFFSTIYLYTYSGWRLKVEPGYNLSSSLSYHYDYVGNGSAPILTPSDTRNTSGGFQLNVGVRKQFGIPLPKRLSKQRFCNVRFVAFLDMNGNKIMDKDEVPLENIVIRLDENEILTNKDGVATFENATWGRYKFQAFSLVDLGAWFPVIPDSIILANTPTQYVPFAKGVKIQGNIEVQREKYSGAFFTDIDISKIRVTLVDSNGRNAMTSITDNKGNFSFYVPYGNYTLAMDEAVLGSNFTIAQNNIDVVLLDGMDNFYYTFFVMENKRRVTKKKFNERGELISENTDLADVYTGTGTNEKIREKQEKEPAQRSRSAKGGAGADKAQDNSASLLELIDKFAMLDTINNHEAQEYAGMYQVNGGRDVTIMKAQPVADLKVRYTIQMARQTGRRDVFMNLYHVRLGTNIAHSESEVRLLLKGLEEGALRLYYHENGGVTILYGDFATQQEAKQAGAKLTNARLGEVRTITIKANELVTPNRKH